MLYVGGRHHEVALMARGARDRGYSLQLVSGDTMSTEEFGLIAGPAAEGTLFTFGARPAPKRRSGSVVERFRAENFEPAGYTLLSYAAVQAWAQAVEKAGSLDRGGDRVAARNSVRHRIGPDRLRREGRSHGSKLGMVRLGGGEYVPLE